MIAGDFLRSVIFRAFFALLHQSSVPKNQLSTSLTWQFFSMFSEQSSHHAAGFSWLFHFHGFRIGVRIPMTYPRPKGREFGHMVSRGAHGQFWDTASHICIWYMIIFLCNVYIYIYIQYIDDFQSDDLPDGPRRTPVLDRCLLSDHGPRRQSDGRGSRKWLVAVVDPSSWHLIYINIHEHIPMIHGILLIYMSFLWMENRLRQGWLKMEELPCLRISLIYINLSFMGVS